MIAQRLSRLVVALLTACLVAACATTQSVPGASPELLTFLADGTTARSDVVLRLGQPSSTLEHEHILTYRIGEDAKHGLFVIDGKPLLAVPWETARHNLVLVFDDHGVLQRHSLVLVK